MDERDQDLDGALLVDGPDLSEDDEADGGGVADAAKAEHAREVLAGIVQRMGIDAQVSIRDVGERVTLDVSGRDAGRAIGKKGQTLDALQFLVNKVVNRFPENRCYVVVDSGDYRERHEQSLVSMARREAKRAVQQGRTITLSPMPARDRRLVHLSLAKFPGVTTKSNGEGMARRIQIIPSRGSTGATRRRRPPAR